MLIFGLYGLLALTGAEAADYEHAIVIVIDDVGVDKVGAYAGDVENPEEQRPATPTVDLLAGSGVRFTDAWAGAACSPTRAVLYSGEYAYRNHIGDVVPDNPTVRIGMTPISVQQLASDSGLVTGLFGKWHLGILPQTPIDEREAFNFKEYPIQTGFSLYKGVPLFDGYESWLYVESEPDPNMPSGYATRATRPTGISLTEQTTNDAITFMEEQISAGKRHLTVVAYNLAHPVPPSDILSYGEAVISCGGTPMATELENQRFVVECLDSEIQRLLKGTPDLEHTLVVLMGDNGTPHKIGEGHFDDGRGKGHFYESGIRVPFIFTDGLALREAMDTGAPAGGVYGIDVGSAISAPTGVVDTYATLVDLLDLSAATCTPGIDCARDSLSLRSALTGGVPIRNTIYTEGFQQQKHGIRGRMALKIDNIKLIAESDTKSKDICINYEMYDLSTDRWEQTDLYHDPAYAEERAALHAELARHAAAMADAPSDWLSYPDCEQDEPAPTEDTGCDSYARGDVGCAGCSGGATGGPLVMLGGLAVLWWRRGGREIGAGGYPPPRRSRSA